MFVHVVYMIYTVIYPYLFIKSRALDFIYLFEEFLTYMTWTFYSGECMVHVQNKRKKDPMYVPGSNDDDNDITKLIGTSKASTILRNYVFPVVRDVGLAIIMLRWKFPLVAIVALIATRETYCNLFTKSKNPSVHAVYTALFSAILLYLTYRCVYK